MSHGSRPRRVRPVVPEQPAPPPPAPTPVQDSAPPPPRTAAPPPDVVEPPDALPPPDGEVLPADPATEGEASPTRKPSWLVELGNKDVGVMLSDLRDDVGYWVKKGRYNKVRLTRDGKQVAPDIPVGAIMAAEVATIAWAGPLRTAVVNLAGRLLFKVELINDAAEHLSAAREHYAKGDLDEAETECVRALKVDPRMADGWLLLGTLAKVRGKSDEALRHYLKARDIDPHGPVGRQAETAARRIDPDLGGARPTKD